MPILKQERNLLPDDLLESHFTGEDRRWWAAYTKARQEKALARDLVRYEVPFYLPLIAKTSLISGRRVESQMPLFSGYLFLFASEEERVRTLSTNRISQLVAVHDQARLQRDLRHLKNLIATNATIVVEDQLLPGRRVRVTSGPFLGIEGTIAARRAGFRLIVDVSFLQQGVSVEIDELLVEPIETSE